MCLARCYVFRITYKLMKFDLFMLSVLILVKVVVMFVILLLFFTMSV